MSYKGYLQSLLLYKGYLSSICSQHPFMSCHFLYNVAPHFLIHAKDWLGSVVNNLRVTYLTHIVSEAICFWPMTKKGFDPCCRVKLVQISSFIFIYIFEPIYTCFELWDICASSTSHTTPLTCLSFHYFMKFFNMCITQLW